MNLDNRTYSKEWSKDIVSRGISHIVGPLGHNSSSKIDIEEYSFFFTMTFHESLMRQFKFSLGKHYEDLSFEFDEFNILYNNLCRSLFGSRWISKGVRHALPLAFVFVDFEGSKYAISTPERIEGFHLHAVFFAYHDAPAMDNERIQVTWEELKRRSTLRSDAVDLRPLNPLKGTLAKLVGYSCKGENLLRNDRRIGSETIRIYPRPGSENPTYPAARRYL